MKETTVVIIGGGATGSGVLRDLAMRGIPALLLEKEYAQTADVLRFLLDQRPPRCAALRLCLHGDGLCSLSDEGSLRMEYVDESGEGILSLLIGMAPARLIVYDLSNGARQELVKALTEIFSGRVCLYTGDFP